METRRRWREAVMAEYRRKYSDEGGGGRGEGNVAVPRNNG
jgi:hypothetical protein